MRCQERKLFKILLFNLTLYTVIDGNKIQFLYKNWKRKRAAPGTDNTPETCDVEEKINRKGNVYKHIHGRNGKIECSSRDKPKKTRGGPKN